MPPRIPSQAIGGAVEAASGQSLRAASQPCYASQHANSFSTSPPVLNRYKRDMRIWMERYGKKFKLATGGPNYLGGRNQPFTENSSFKSQPVLSEWSREEIWKAVIARGESIKAVSSKYGVDMRRVAAVVRLKELEKAWAAQVSWFRGCSSRSLPTHIAHAIPAFMMITFKNRLVLKTTNHGYKHSFASLSDPSHFLFSTPCQFFSGTRSGILADTQWQS